MPGGDWRPYPTRPHTDEELVAMESHVSVTKRPVFNDLRAYRVSTAREGRFQATLPPPGAAGGGSSKKRSVTAPSGRRTPSPPVPQFSYHGERVERARPTKVMTEAFPPNPDGVAAVVASRTYPAFSGSSGGRALPPPWAAEKGGGTGGGRVRTPRGATGDAAHRSGSTGQRRARTPRKGNTTPRATRPPGVSGPHSMPPPQGFRKGHGPAALAAQTSPVPSAQTPSTVAPQRTPMRTPGEEHPPGTADTRDEMVPQPTPPDASVHRIPSAQATSRSGPQGAVSPPQGRATARPNGRDRDSAVLRSRSAPSGRITGHGAAPPPSSTAHLRGTMPKDRTGIVRAVVELVAELATIDKAKGGARQRQVGQASIDHGWHVVVQDLERQLAQCKAQQRAMAAAHEREKEMWKRESEGALIAQMADIEAFYEERLSEWKQEVQHVEHMNAELRREAVELRKMFQQQDTQHAAGTVTHLLAEDGSVRRRRDDASTAGICLVTSSRPSPAHEALNTSITSTAPPPTHAQSPSAVSTTDNAAELVPVLLSPRPCVFSDPPASIALSQPSSVARGQVSATTPPPTAPSPISPFHAMGGTQDGSDDGRRYLDMVDKQALAHHLVHARMELDYERRKAATASQHHPDHLYGPSWNHKKKTW